MPEITRLNSDANGNSRFCVHFLGLEPADMHEKLRLRLTLTERYARAVKLANKLGGRRYHCKAYGGGVAFQAQEHQLPEIITRIHAMQKLAG